MGNSCLVKMKILGIQFSPLKIPSKRRWETFAVFFWMATFMFSTLFLGPVFILVYILFYTRFWHLGIVYLLWMVFDIKTCFRGGRKGFLAKFVRGWRLWKHFA